MEKFRFLWSSNSKFSIFLKYHPRVWYRAIIYCSLSIEFGSKYASESQTLLIRFNNILLCVIYSSILYSEQSTEQCTHCALLVMLHSDKYHVCFSQCLIRLPPSCGSSTSTPPSNLVPVSLTFSITEYHRNAWTFLGLQNNYFRCRHFFTELHSWQQSFQSALWRKKSEQKCQI